MEPTPPAGHDSAARLKSSLLGMIGSFVLFTTYLAVPPIGVFSGVLAPFPAGYSRLVHGRPAALIVTLGAATAVSALFGIFAGCLYLGMCATIGLFMPELLARGIGGGRTLFWTTAVNVTILAAGVLGYSALSGINLQQLLSAEINGSLTQAVAIYEKSGVKGDDLELVKQTMNTVADMLHRLYPSLITLLLVVMAGCNLALLKRTTVKSGIELNVGDFASYRNPDMLVWLLIAAGFALLLTSPLVTTPALNIMLIVALLYFLQGMAVVSTLISKQSFSGMLRTGLYIMLVIQPYLAAVIAGIGLCDLWVDFRTPKQQENL
ncbi:MAG: YybS family protein [Desulfuromonadales bacterium]